MIDQNNLSIMNSDDNRNRIGGRPKDNPFSGAKTTSIFNGKQFLSSNKRKRRKDLIAPIIFTGSFNAEGFEGWLSIYLLPSLIITSVLIMDNALIHRKTVIKQIV